MKRFVSCLLAVVCLLSLAACGSGEIEASKKPFPEFAAVDFDGNAVTNELFADHAVTVVNVWSNSCGPCIEEMPELEEYYQQFQEENVHLIAVNVSAGVSDEEYRQTQTILEEKGVTFPNLIVDPDSDFYKDFIGQITGYPTTYLVDAEGNIVGAPLVGTVKNQEENFLKRIEEIKG